MGPTKRPLLSSLKIDSYTPELLMLFMRECLALSATVRKDSVEMAAGLNLGSKTLDSGNLPVRSNPPDAPTTPSGTIDRLTTPSSLLWHPRRCYGRSPFVIHFLQVYNPTMSVIQFFLAKLYGTRRGNNWHEGFHYKANGKTKLWSSESRGNKQI